MAPAQSLAQLCALICHPWLPTHELTKLALCGFWLTYELPCYTWPVKSDHELLKAALVGYQHEVDQLQARMAEIRRELGAGQGAAAAPEPTRRTMSAAGRRRIAAAQRKRWAAQKAAKPALEPAKERRMSAAGRKRIAAATRKRWAQFRARKAAAAR